MLAVVGRRDGARRRRQRRSRAASARRGRSAGSASRRAMPTHVWVESAAGGFLSSDGGQSFRAPLSTGAFRRAQVAQATLLADGKTLVAMPTVWSAQQFTPPRWSADGGATWEPGKLAGADAHYDFGDDPGFVGESPVTADPGDPRTAWFCQGNLYVTHDAGRSWAVATPRLKRPWHCAALAIATGRPHTLILLVQSKARNPAKVPGKLLRSTDGGATWRRRQGAALPAGRLQRPRPRVRSGGALDRAPARGGRRHPRLALPLARRRRSRGSACDRTALRGALVEQFAFASDGRALALARMGNRQRVTFTSLDGGERWSGAPPLALGSRSPAIYPSPLASSGTSFLLGTNRAASGGWRPAPAAGPQPDGGGDRPVRGPAPLCGRAAGARRRARRLGGADRPSAGGDGAARDPPARARRGPLVCRRRHRHRRVVADERDRLAALGTPHRPRRAGARAGAAGVRLSRRPAGAGAARDARDAPCPRSSPARRSPARLLSPLGACMRALWPVLLPTPGLRDTAYALEAWLQEVFFLFGPLLVAAIAVVAAPWVAIVAAAACAGIGTLWFALTPALARVERGTRADSRAGALGSPAVRTIVIASLALGVAFGIVEVSMPAFAEVARLASAGRLRALVLRARVAPRRLLDRHAPTCAASRAALRVRPRARSASCSSRRSSRRRCP